MHARNRSPANGYRSNPMGIGGPAYRNYNRSGFGRGHPKIFQSPPPPPRSRSCDVFMEAGKLATDYLVSKGLLPQSVLNGKWQNNTNFKNHVISGDAIPDTVSATVGGRRRFPDDYSSARGSKDSMRERRRMGSFKNPGFEWNQEINRSDSWSEKVAGSPDKQENDDAYSGYMEEQPSRKDVVHEEQKSVQSGDLDSKSCDVDSENTAIEKNQNQSANDNVSLKEPSSDVSHEGGVESTERSDCSKNLSMGKEEVMMDVNNNGESEKPTVTEDTPMENKDDPAKKTGNDLLTLIRFNKVPTRTRSSMTLKGSKIDPVLIAEDENTNESQNSEQSGGALRHVPSGDAQSDESQRLNPESEATAAAEEDAELDDKYKLGQGVCTRSQSFPGRSSITEQEPGEGHLGYNRCSSEVLERGEKRPLNPIDSMEGAKKSRDWAQTDNYLHLSKSRGDGKSSQEGGSSSPQEESCNEYAEEKQLFPGSFKICDLNLMEVSDVIENQDTNLVRTFPPMRQPKQETVPVNFDLSMSSNCNITDRHSRRGADGKEVEVIDLENDYVQEDNVFNNSERKDETIFTDLDSFPDSMQRVHEMPQDNYGLMISELLEADIPSCSTVPTGVNSMHNEIGLRNEEGVLGDDESIYMSLGEIPISMPEL